jgi:enterochelin esterase-like enzyme
MIQHLKVISQAIKGFPMGDAHERDLPVYLPPTYKKNRKEPYPVVFFLAGWGNKGSAYLSDDSAFGISLQARFDQAINDGRMQEFIGVFPDGTSKVGCSQYINSPAFGNYMDHLCDELTAIIDKEFHTHASADFRAIVGHSSGGFGALANGFMRPDAFKYLCSSAGDSFYELSLMPNLNNVMSELQKSGSLVRFVDEFLSHPSPKNLPRAKGEAMMTLSMAPCYAPNTGNAPLYGDLFFDIQTGKIIPEVWEKYLSWDPVRMVEKYLKNIQKLKFILLESGTQDEHGLQWGHRQLGEKLKAHGIPFSLNEYPGGHSGHHWRFETRVKTLLEKME